MDEENTGCNIIVSCVVLHNYCWGRNIDYPVDDNVAAKIEKENEVALALQHSERSSD